MIKIDILEYNNYHYGILPTWIYVFLILEKERSVCLYINQDNKKTDINYFFNKKICMKNIYLKSSDSLIYKILELPLKLLLKIIGKIIKYPFQNESYFFRNLFYDKNKIIVFNSIEPKNILMKAIYFAKRKYKIIVVLHNADKILDNDYRSFLFRENVEVFVLSEMVRDYLIAKGLLKVKLFSPVFFDNILKRETNKKVVLAVQGTVDFQRRNYYSLIEAVEKLVNEYKIINFVVKIVGNSNTRDGHLVKNEVHKKKLKDYFVFFSDTLEYRKFFKEISNSDYLLILQDKTSFKYLPYFEYKCSGAINLSLGFNKITIMHSELVKLNNFENICISYGDGNLVSALNSAINMNKKKKMKLKY